jgi:hypothetical protein
MKYLILIFAKNIYRAAIDCFSSVKACAKFFKFMRRRVDREKGLCEACRGVAQRAKTGLRLPC